MFATCFRCGKNVFCMKLHSYPQQKQSSMNGYIAIYFIYMCIAISLPMEMKRRQTLYWRGYQRNQLKSDRVIGYFQCVEVDTNTIFWMACSDDACASQQKNNNNVFVGISLLQFSWFYFFYTMGIILKPSLKRCLSHYSVCTWYKYIDSIASISDYVIIVRCWIKLLIVCHISLSS